MADLYPALQELADDEDELEGCAVDMTENPVADEDLPYVVLAGGLEGEAARERIEEYRRFFGGMAGAVQDRNR